MLVFMKKSWQPILIFRYCCVGCVYEEITDILQRENILIWLFIGHRVAPRKSRKEKLWNLVLSSSQITKSFFGSALRLWHEVLVSFWQTKNMTARNISFHYQLKKVLLVFIFMCSIFFVFSTLTFPNWKVLL